ICLSRGATKGAAAERYLAVCRAEGAYPRVVAAIGDGGNDESLLRAVPQAFVINRPGRGHAPRLAAIPGAVLLSAPGSLGWIEAITSLVSTSIPEGVA
ncbi:MAG: hypothetical protein ACOY71_00695, partial [Gemmatimonadota bacterium]